MGSEILHVGLTAMCPHGSGQVSVVQSVTNVKVGGNPVAVKSDTFTIAGCVFTVPPAKPQPCMEIQWITAALKVKAGGTAVLLKTSSGLCQSADKIPAGPPNISVVQSKVKAT